MIVSKGMKTDRESSTDRNAFFTEEDLQSRDSCICLAPHFQLSTMRFGFGSNIPLGLSDTSILLWRMRDLLKLFLVRATRHSSIAKTYIQPMDVNISFAQSLPSVIFRNTETQMLKPENWIIYSFNLTKRPTYFTSSVLADDAFPQWG